jgi:ATP-dependent helicase/DNAse subunit B
VYLDDHLGRLFEANELPSATSLLQKQAQCAFQAYAQYRLAAQPFPRSQLGVRALTQGSVIHDALRELWNVVQSSQRWNDASEDARQVWIVGAVARSFGPLARECAQRGMPEVATQALKTHCETLLTRWMYDVEAQRAPFTIAQTEAGAALTLSDKRLRLRLDRIDHLADGSALVIDYKTGNVSGLKALEAGDRAALYPQLPAYALAVQARGEESVSGVAYARLVCDEMKLTGIAAVESADETSNTWFQAPKTTGQTRRTGSAWQALLARWEAALTHSVQTFCAGEAGVLPVDDQVCRNCQRHALCRVGSVDNDPEGGADE